MASQVQSFLHLFAVAADESHEPQVFRMRWDQPLRRFARAYAAFRELGTDAEAMLRMSMPGHAYMDPAATASVYGLAEWDQVTFTKTADSSAVLEPAPATTALAQPPQDPVSPASDVADAVAAEALPGIGTNAQAAASVPEGGDSSRDAVGEKRFCCPVKGCKDDYARDIGFDAVEDYNEHLQFCHPSSKVTKLMIADIRAERERNRGVAEAEAEEEAEAEAEEEKETTSVIILEDEDVAAEVCGINAGRGRGSGRGRHGSAHGRAATGARGGSVSARCGDLLAWRVVPTSKGRGSDGAPDEAAAGGGQGVVGRTGRGRGRGRGRGSNSMVGPPPRPVATPSGGRDPQAGEPGIPRSLVRSTTCQAGPAKGWRVTAWLQDTSGQQKNTAVRWRVLSPGRTREFDGFRAKLRKEVGEGIYAQLHSVVRPELQRRINEMRLVAEGGDGVAPKKRGGPSATGAEHVAPAPPMTRRKTVAVAAPLFEASRASSCLATQMFAPADSVVPDKAWAACGCYAHLRRHPQCIFGGGLQPLLVHLDDYMVIGRGEACDIVLDSRRTPQMISRCHAVLNREDGVFVLVDQGAVNSSMVNGQPLKTRQELQDGDIVTFGVTTSQPEFDYIFEVRPQGA
mmetsp:Transcript_14053/g.31407  ORF Transcript_14053/g.31407 Transcript_14053/m.31407 type:complete len:627 (-) Transcript_14053:146-2026(-)